MGGRRRGTELVRPGKDSYKTPVFGMMESKGRVVAAVVRDTKRATVMPHVHKKVLPETTVYTDEYRVYNNLNRQDYPHNRVRHAEEIYVAGDVHTNTIESFWSLLKRRIAGVYHSVSAKHLKVLERVSLPVQPPLGRPAHVRHNALSGYRMNGNRQSP